MINLGEFILPYYTLFILSIVLLFFIGYYYIQLFLKDLLDTISGNEFKTISYSLTAGLIITTSFISVFYAHFNTVFLFPFIILLIPVLKKRKDNINNYILFIPKISPQKVLVFFLIAHLVFGYNTFVFYRKDGFIHFDFLFYGKIAEGLINHGYESALAIYGNFYNSPCRNLYHYGDLWITGFLSLIEGKSSTFCLVYITYPLLHTLLLYLLFSVNIVKNPLWNNLLMISIIYGSKLFFHLPPENWLIRSLVGYRGIPSAYFPNKTLIIYVLMVFAYALFNNKHKIYSYIILSLVPIFYTSISPVFAGISASILGITILNKIISNKRLENNTPILALLIIISLAFILAYNRINISFSAYKIYLEVYTIKSYVILFFETIFKVFAESFLIVFLFIYVIIKHGLKILFRPFILISLSGVISGYLFIYTFGSAHKDFHQVLFNISPVFVMIISIEVFRLVEKRIQKILCVVMLLFSLWNLFNFKFEVNTYGNKKLSYTLSNNFKTEVLNFAYGKDQKITSCSISNKFGYGNWIYNLDNKFQELFIYNHINVPLEIQGLFEKKSIKYKEHPYYCYYPDSIVSIKRIIEFMKIKGAYYLFLDNNVNVPEDFLSHYTVLFEDKKNNLSFLKMKL
jgi:hypothetical protein